MLAAIVDTFGPFSKHRTSQDIGLGPAKASKKDSGQQTYLYEPICRAGHQQLAVRGEPGNLCMALLAELDGAVHCCGESLHLIPLTLRLTPEQVKCGAWREDSLILLPAKPHSVSTDLTARGAGNSGESGNLPARNKELLDL